MGLFSSKKKTYVSSSVYNLAGDINFRPDYKQVFTMKYVFGDPRASFAETINSSYLNGPGIKFRSYGRWARTQGYSNAVGHKGSKIRTIGNIDPAVLKQAIGISNNKNMLLIKSEIEGADYSYWAERYLLDNYPNMIWGSWRADIDPETYEITIIFSDNTEFIFTPTDYDPDGEYLFAQYQESEAGNNGILNVGSLINLLPNQQYPSTENFNRIEFEVNTENVVLNTVTIVKTYVNEVDPPTIEESTETVNVTGSVATSTWYKVDSTKEDVDTYGEYVQLKTWQYHYDNYEIKNNTTETTEIVNGNTVVTTIVSEELITTKSYRINTRKDVITKVSEAKLFIYKRDTGKPTLDVLFTNTNDMGDFIPFIPIRHESRFLSNSYQSNIKNNASKAIKKALDTSYDEMIKKIAKTPSLNDIDYAYITFGVSLNTKEPEGRRYIYEFFTTLRSQLGSELNSYKQWKADYQKAYEEWLEYSNNFNNRIFIKSRPAPIPNRKNMSLNVRGALGYNMTISFMDIHEKFGTGKVISSMKRGDVIIRYLGTDSFYNFIPERSSGITRYTRNLSQSADIISIVFQITDNTWRELKIYGLSHSNLIYRGKSVVISGTQALRDREESGFIIPLHEGIFKNIPLVKGTQLCTSCSYVVFNSYQVVKSKWYQSGIFKLVVFVVAIVVTFYTGGAGAGLLGTNLAVGSALGFTGIAAIVAGAIANGIAAAIVSQIIQTASTELLGDELGALIGSIASIAVISIGSSIQSGQGWAVNFDKLFSPTNLIKLSGTLGNGYANKINADTAELNKKSQELLSDFQTQSEEIAKLYAQNIGYGNMLLSPFDITDAFSNTMQIESASTFISRTLLTGVDIANISQSMISNFSGITLDLNLQF